MHLTRPSRPLRIAVYSSDAPGLACSQIRFAAPAAFSQGAIELTWSGRPGPPNVEDDLDRARNADVIAIARFFPQEANWPLIEGLLASGRPVIYDLDDLLLELPPENPFFEDAARIRPYVTELLSRADLVTTTTAGLAAEFEARGADTRVIPNGVDPRLFCGPVRRSGDVFTLAYAGTPTHAHDLGTIEQAVVSTLERLGSRVQLLLLGCATERLASHPRCRVVPFEIDYAAYAARLRGAEIDLLLTPLANNAFNRCKSAIKWLEASATGIAGIYSALSPYTGSIDDGQTGVLRSGDAQDWLGAIEWLIEDEEARLRIAATAQRRVLDRHTADRSAERLLDTCGELVGPARPPRPQARDGAVRCSVVIPVFNRLDLTRRCVESLSETPAGIEYEVIVVDDGSTDGTHEFLAAACTRNDPVVRSLRHESNRGFAAACNSGERVARGEYVIFLNNDTEAQSDWLKALVRVADESRDVAIVGSRLLYADDTVQHAGLAISRRFLLPCHLWKGVHRDEPRVARRRELRAVTGACMLVRRSVFAALGGFDEGYRNGFEDADLCLRAIESGHRVVYEPASTLYHLEEQSEGRKRDDSANARRFLSRWGYALWADEDLRYFEDDCFTRVGADSDGPVLLHNNFEGEADRARWRRVAEVQARAFVGDDPELRSLLEDPSAWPQDPDVRVWAAELCAALGLGECASRFRRPDREPAWLDRGVAAQLQQI